MHHVAVVGQFLPYHGYILTYIRLVAGQTKPGRQVEKLPAASDAIPASTSEPEDEVDEDSMT
jgi:hypothetical protein